MGWEVRRGKRVYYRKVREAGRVRSVYCGAGERGERAAREDEERRAARLLTPGFGQLRTKKEPAEWPTVDEIVEARRDFGALGARYPPHTLPRDDEQLVEWYARRRVARPFEF